ncbi:MAG TPA: exonuclease domain-containing protein [Bacteroidia bacterium]|jgi:DNA polymerase-3 subunit epsilon|nr:exonuclease domain-containing protein [Bacteroidia bacterium]
MFSIIDIETCGGRFEYPKGRIIEISIVQHDGLQVTDKFTTLINPGCYISPLYTRISGITNDMVSSAPTFQQVAKTILEMTEGRIFVAHNVGFDYGFIKEEFKSLGYKYSREKLCTVRLSRKLIPGKVSYSLGNLCASLNIPIEGRHRAEGDAVATAKLFDLLLQLKTMDPQYKTKGVNEIMGTRIDKIKSYILKKLPEECGVYYFLDKEGKIIYIGKSNNMYQRAQSHFNSKESRSKKMLNDLYDVSYQLTGSELIALLVESEEIKKHHPYYNRARKADSFTHSIDWSKDEKGIINFKIAESEESTNALRSFTSYLSARECLERWLDDHTLCLRYCGLTDEDAICFNHQIKKCYGICAGEEEVEEYNKRAAKILKEFSFGDKDFIIIEEGRHREERSLILVENGHYAGHGYADITGQVNSPEDLKDSIKKTSTYPDNDDIIRGWLKNHNVKTILLNGVSEMTE